MVFDDDMRASARVLARHALIGGGVNGGIGDGDNGGGGGSAWGMKGVSGAIRESLVSYASDTRARNCLWHLIQPLSNHTSSSTNRQLLVTDQPVFRAS